MSYLVLARKWRPRRFSELVGQTHVVRALTNALESGRVHHAFLFTGTRGVGKTTIARIFAKSLNCERGDGAEPCGECATCLDIDAGRYVDLLEIDAASNTGVDDVREVIENSRYLPSRGRTKVYLIDEVHMLSKPAFNALLKTLEEPPPHVKFLLATTDPQKLLVTVLSRCLQFNLKRLDLGQIRGQMEKILTAEGMPAEPGALALLARGADGSLRDGLSLLDQAIAYTAGKLDEAGVRAMLGSVDHARVAALLDALGAADGIRLMAEIDALAGFSPDFGQVLDDVAAALHRIQLQQLVPGSADETDAADAFDSTALAAQLAPELVQLWYQMAINGRRDLPMAPSQRVGFEMTLLRMLAFRPTDSSVSAGTEGSSSNAVSRPARDKAAKDSPTTPIARATATLPPVAVAVAVQPAPIATAVREPASPAPIAPVQPPSSPAEPTLAHLHSTDDWHALVSGGALKGPIRDLAAQATFVDHADGVLTLALPDALEHLRNPALVGKLADALATHLGVKPKITFAKSASSDSGSLHAREARERVERQAGAEKEFLENPSVQRYMQQFGAKLVSDSIRPIDEKP